MKIKTCWNCLYQQLGGDFIFGMCKYFNPVREIPQKYIDTGCRHWKEKPENDFI